MFAEDSLINFDQWKDNCNGGRQHGLYSDVYQAIRNQDQIVTSEKNHLVNEQIVGMNPRLLLEPLRY